MTRRRRLVLVVAGLAMMALVCWVAMAVVPKIPVATGYVALRMASGLAVQDRDLRAELAEDDALIGHMTIAVASDGAVTVDLWGLAPRRAAPLAGYGAHLDLGRAVPPRPDPWGGMVVRAQPWPVAELDPARRAALAAVLDAAFAEPADGRRRTHAVVVIHRGRLVAERYAPGFDADSRLLGWSMTKSVASILAGRLIHLGLLDLDQPAGLWPDGDPRAAITLRHLLAMTSGLDFHERAALSDLTRMLFAHDDVGAFAADFPLAHAPGEELRYTSAETVLLSAAIRRRFADDAAYWRFPYRELFAPLGMTSALIETDAAGTFQLSSFGYATARDWCRLGQLMLQDGVWNGRRLLPPGWVERCRTPDPRSREGQAYALGWWLCAPVPETGGERWLPAIPADAYAAWGHRQQLLMVVPSADLVVVRFGLSRPASSWDQEALVTGLLAALDETVAAVRSEP